MGRAGKLLAKARRNPSGLAFREFEALLRACGWVLDRQAGSHRLWRSPRGSLLPVQPRGSKAKGYPIRCGNSCGFWMRKMARTDPFDGHVVEVFLDEEGDWVARFEDRPEISAFGRTPAGALESLAEAWRLVRESHLSRGERPAFPAAAGAPRLQLRLGRGLYRALALEARRRGLSVRTLAARKLAAGLCTRRSGEVATERRD